MGFLSVPNLVPWFFQSLNRHSSVLLDHVALQLNREGIKGGKDGKKSAGWGGLFEEGDYFKYFHQRVAIVRGRRLIEGWLLFEEILYAVFLEVVRVSFCVIITCAVKAEQLFYTSSTVSCFLILDTKIFAWICHNDQIVFIYLFLSCR